MGNSLQASSSAVIKGIFINYKVKICTKILLSLLDQFRRHYSMNHSFCYFRFFLQMFLLCKTLKSLFRQDRNTK